MPDPIFMAWAMGLAFVASAVILAACVVWGSRRAHGAAWIDAGWVLSLGIGFYLGCRALGIWPHWPPLEDQDRLLALVIPFVLGIELLAAVPSVPGWLIGTLRLAMVGLGARILLHETIYLTDVAGPGTREWSPAVAWLVLGCLAASEAAVWALMSLLTRRRPGVSPVVCLSVSTAGSAVTIMLSGYATGGQAGLPLAAALLGATAVAPALRPGPARGTGAIGVAVVGLFSLLVIGRFFGELSSPHAILLFSSPLLGWLPELPGLRRLAPWARGLARVLFTAFLVFAIVIHAAWKFVAESQPSTGPGSNEPAIEDYTDFGR
jgi:hypothetical protein